MDSDVIVWVPAHAGSVHLLRTVAASAGARLELSIDDIEDVRLAVTEAASQLLTERPSARRIRMCLADEGSAMRVTVTLEGGDPDTAPDGPAVRERAEGSLAWQVLLALGDDVRFVGEGGEIGVTFTKARNAGTGGGR